MKLKDSRPMDGLAWMRQGLLTFRQQPMAFTSLMALVMFLMGLLLIIPTLGPLLMLASLPGLSAGWVACGYAARSGQRPSAGLLFTAFKGPSRAGVLTLGIVFAAMAWLVFNLIDSLDPDFHAQWALAMSSESSDEARGEALVAAQQGMLLRAMSMVPLALLFWHAPVLAHREGASAAKALFGSVLTIKHHLSTFAVYGLGWLAADVAVSVCLGLLLGVLGAGQWAIALAMPLSLVFCAAFYASLYATVEGCLQIEDSTSQATAPLQ
jgi:hypothetical protein